jgi:hypothetical protein
LTFDFPEQFVGVFGPEKWVAAVVIGVDELPLVARLSQPRADFGMLVRAVVVVPCRT